MAENEKPDGDQHFFSAITEWIDTRNIERLNDDNPEDGVWKIRLPISDNQFTSASLLALSSGVVLFIILDLEVRESQRTDLMVLASTINSKIPFGSFDVDPIDEFVFFRDSTRIAFETIAPDSLDKVFSNAVYNIRTYQTLLKAMSEGLLDRKAALDSLIKLESDSGL